MNTKSEAEARNPGFEGGAKATGEKKSLPLRKIIRLWADFLLREGVMRLLASRGGFERRNIIASKKKPSARRLWYQKTRRTIYFIDICLEGRYPYLMTDRAPEFTFSISLSVLNHLGRNLYRSFTTVLGEAISNAWDADANDVWVYIDSKNNNLVVKDNGVGMDAYDFQNKFLKIGYSKRKDGDIKSPNKKRPYIGRKGIGKLALLSCAKKVTVISKKKDEYIGGVIDNSGLDKAITDDLIPTDYKLDQVDISNFGPYTRGHKHGTIIRFEGIHDGIKPHFEFLKKVVALYFRFALIDDSFKIHIDGKKVTYKDLQELASKTQFVWHTRDFDDPFLTKSLIPTVKEKKTISLGTGIRGFIASVVMPRDLSIYSTGERVSIDLFVNGRLREMDIVKHLSIAKVAENYMYGQIHIDSLDDSVDRFTTSREGVVPDDNKYTSFLKDFRKTLDTIIREWDPLRRGYRFDGNPEDEHLSRKERKSDELYNAVAGEYTKPKGKGAKLVRDWVDQLADDARFNFASYAECFISENLIRKYVQHNKIALTQPAKDEIMLRKGQEKTNKQKGNISIAIRKNGGQLGYLSMDSLAKLVDKKDPLKEACLPRDANEYKPMRDAIAHTSLLTDVAKKKLTSVYENVKGRVQSLLARAR